ncbi:MAG: 50S ribosomal protein L10 [Parcubacteria group bacterium]|nr:MAG: 50S ribosomal protein L10 [Parcubacteria group bacterium]
MPKSKAQKKKVLEDIKEKIAKSKAVVFSSDKGLNVKTVEKMRRELKQGGAEYLVAKKTILQLATKELGEAEALDNLRGSVGVTLSYGDEVTGPKIINKYAKENEALELGSGILENKFVLADMVKRLATLPSREQLLAKLVGTINAPISGLVQVLSGNTRKLVYALSAIKEKKS